MLSVAAIGWTCMAIEAQFPADCGNLKHSYTQPLLSQAELIAMPSNCSFSPLAEYLARTHWISSRERPCTWENILDTYPPPTCKRGEEVRMTTVQPVWRPGGGGWRKVTVGVLCCPFSGGGIADDGVGTGNRRHASAQTDGNEVNARNDGDL